MKENVFLNLTSWTKHIGQGHANFVIGTKRNHYGGFCPVKTTLNMILTYFVVAGVDGLDVLLCKVLGL